MIGNMTTRLLNRPVPLVCEECSHVIGADEECRYDEKGPPWRARHVVCPDQPEIPRVEDGTAT